MWYNKSVCIKLSWEDHLMNYDIIIIGAGPGGIFSAYELSLLAPALKVAVFAPAEIARRTHQQAKGL